jgi:hypothetical protein
MTELREISFHPPSEEVRKLISINGEQRQWMGYFVGGLIVLGVWAVYVSYRHNVLKDQIIKSKLNESGPQKKLK